MSRKIKITGEMLPLENNSTNEDGILGVLGLLGG